jgi:hypothetical protein
MRKLLTVALCTGAAILRTWSEILWDASEKVGERELA